MSNRPNFGSEESLRRNSNEPRPYSCSICAKDFPTSQAWAGHHNALRPWYSHCVTLKKRTTPPILLPLRLRLTTTKGLCHQTPSLISFRPMREQPISRPFYSFLQTEPYDRTPADPAPETEPRSCLGPGSGRWI